MNRVRGWFLQALRHAPLALGGLAVLIAWSAPVAIAAFALADLAYVAYVTAVISSLRRVSWRAGDEVAERRWAAFRTRAALLMDAASVAFVALSIVTHDTLPWPWPRWTAIAAALALGAVGLGTKAWAAWSLPRANFFWRDVFFPDEPSHFSRAGPYRWLANPMYTVGYAHTYGLGLLTLSLPTLAGAAFAQSLILLFNRFVERPAASRRAVSVAAGAGRAASPSADGLPAAAPAPPA